MLHLKIKNKKTVYPPTGYLMNLRCAESPAFYVKEVPRICDMGLAPGRGAEACEGPRQGE